MKKNILSAFAAGALALSFLASGSAVAQNNLGGLSVPSNPIFTKKSPEELATLLTIKGVPARVVKTDSGLTLVAVSIGENSGFFIRPIGCSENDPAGRCSGMQTYAFLPGVSLGPNQVNQLNLSTLFVTLRDIGNNRVNVGRSAIFDGGVTNDHFYANIAIFVGELQDVVDALSAIKATVQNETNDEKIMAASFSKDMAEAAIELDQSIVPVETINGVPISNTTFNGGTLPFGTTRFSDFK